MKRNKTWGSNCIPNYVKCSRNQARKIPKDLISAEHRCQGEKMKDNNIGRGRVRVAGITKIMKRKVQQGSE